MTRRIASLALLLGLALVAPPSFACGGWKVAPLTAGGHAQFWFLVVFLVVGFAAVPVLAIAAGLRLLGAFLDCFLGRAEVVVPVEGTGGKKAPGESGGLESNGVTHWSDRPVRAAALVAGLYLVGLLFLLAG